MAFTLVMNPIVYTEDSGDFRITTKLGKLTGAEALAESALDMEIHVTGGSLFLGTTNKGASGTFNFASDITGNTLVFRPDGSGPVTMSFQAKAHDASQSSNVSHPLITYKEVNDAPVLSTLTLASDGAKLQEGGKVTITRAMIGASDEETPDAGNITFKITKVVGGGFFADGIASKAFTLADIDNGLISFVDDGKDGVAPTFALQAVDSDGKAGAVTEITAGNVHFQEVNDAPMISVKAITPKPALKLNSATKEYVVTPVKTVLSSVIKIADEETKDLTRFQIKLTDFNGADLIETANGGKQAIGATFTADKLASFATQVKDFVEDSYFDFEIKDLDQNKVVGHIHLPVYALDPQGFDVGNATIKYANQAPMITNASITIERGDEVDFTLDNLGFSEFYSKTENKLTTTNNVDTDNAGMTFTVSAKNGAFYVEDQVATVFSLEDLQEGRVTFCSAEGHGLLPSFTIAAKDRFGMAGKAFTGTVDFVPEIYQKAPLALTEGGMVKLSAANLLIDADKSQLAGLSFKIEGEENLKVQRTNDDKTLTDLAEGQFFFYSELAAGKISLIHDASNVAPELELSLWSGEQEKDDLNLSFAFKTVNDKPVFSVGNLALTTGVKTDLTYESFDVSDEESAGSINSFMINVKTAVGIEFYRDGGATAVKAFTLQDVADHLVQVKALTETGSYSMTITDGFGLVSLPDSGLFT